MTVSEETDPGILAVILVLFKKYVLWIVVIVAGCCCVSYCMVMGTCCHFGHYKHRKGSLSRQMASLKRKTQRTAYDAGNGYDDYRIVRGKVDHLDHEDGDESEDSHSQIYDEPLDGQHGHDALDGLHGRRDRVNTISIAAVHGVASRSHQSKYDRVRSESAMLRSEMAHSIQIGTPKQAKYRKYRASQWSRHSKARLSVDLQETAANDGVHGLSEGDEGDDEEEEEDGLWRDSLSTSTDDDRVEEMYLRNRHNTTRRRKVKEKEEERLMQTDNAQNDEVQDAVAQNEGVRGLESGVGDDVVLETSADALRVTDDPIEDGISRSRGLEKETVHGNTSVDLEKYPSLPPEQAEEKRIVTR